MRAAGRFACAVLLLALPSACVGVVDAGPTPSSALPAAQLRPAPAGLRTLTPTQYAASVRTVLGLPAGAPVTPVGQWATSIAAARGGLGATTVEAYETSARTITASLFADTARRDALFDGCTPTSSAGDACTREVLATVGRRAFRRPLTDDETARWTTLAREIGTSLGDPYRGIELAITGLLQSPHFLYRVEVPTPDLDAPASDPRSRYESFELATRLAYLLWNATPDDALLDEAASGALLEPEGLDAAIARMQADPRAVDGIEAFLADLLQVDGLRSLEKDPTLFPGFEAMHASLAPQLVRTATTAVIEGGLPALFTSRTTYVDPALAPLYGLDPASLAPGLTRLELDESSPRVGILTTPGILAMFAYPGKTSPALRGLFVRRRLLCQTIAPPPPSVSTVLPEPPAGTLVTTRQLVAMHQREETCAGCHRLMDPTGLALEHFDADGSYRALHNGLAIDTSGELDGTAFDDVEGLSIALSEHELFVPCVTAQLFGSAIGTTADARHRQIRALASSGEGDLPRTLAALARSDAFRFAWGALP